MRISVFFIVLLSMGISVAGQAQSSCKSSVKASSARNGIKVTVSGSGQFSGKLIEYEGTREIVVKEFTGANNLSFVFENIKANRSYRAQVTFLDEQSFICRNKTSEFIDIDSKGGK
ncbi:MAG TPA: hypothetical protein VIN08_17925 [Ohtaekwangia sp.]|uniref:hypothetical protein n=1 Tax=Ohtaekwangia sp. TaxID=2066019 RepID=UPI002F940601